MNPIILHTITQYEGGFQDDPDDPGNYTPDGRLVGTKYGIAAKYHPDVDIRNLTIEQAHDIYVKEYWDPMRCGEIHDSLLQQMLFDSAVNLGLAWTIKAIQRIVDVTVDGTMGPETVNAVNAMNMQANYSLDRDFAFARVLYYISRVTANPAKLKYLNGWVKRATDGLDF